MTSAERLCLIAARSEAVLADFVVLFLVRWALLFMGVKYKYFQPVLDQVSPPLTLHDFNHAASAIFYGSMYYVSGLPEIIFAGMWVVYSIVSLAIFGKTIGMRQSGLSLVDAKGDKPSLARIIVRQLVKPISSIAWIGYWSAGFTRNAETLHDWISGTRVILTERPHVVILKEDDPGDTPESSWYS